MTFLESLVVDGFGLAIVFAVLIALSLIIKLISFLFRRANAVTPENVQADVQLQPEFQHGEGALKLTDVDEKTAAAIMAIVSKKTEIPLSRLRFNSITRVNKEAGK